MPRRTPGSTSVCGTVAGTTSNDEKEQGMNQTEAAPTGAEQTEAEQTGDGQTGDRQTEDELAGDAGMSTAEYAIGTVAACGFAGVLWTVVHSDAVARLMQGVVERALTLGT
jgi:hypothetical protein